MIKEELRHSFDLTALQEPYLIKAGMLPHSLSMHNTERKLQKRRTDFGAFFFSTQLVCPFIFSPIQGGRKQGKKRRQIYSIFVFSFFQSHPKAGFVNRKKADIYIYFYHVNYSRDCDISYRLQTFIYRTFSTEKVYQLLRHMSF